MTKQEQRDAINGYLGILAYVRQMGSALYAVETAREAEVGKESDDYLLSKVREALRAYQAIKDGEHLKPITVESLGEPVF